MSEKNVILTLKQLVSVSEYSEDIAYDLNLIYQDRLHHFGKNAEDFELYRLLEHYQDLNRFKITPSNTNRIYLITGMEYIVAVCPNISESLKRNIVRFVSIELSRVDALPIDNIDPNLISSLYVMESDKCAFAADFYPYMLGILTHCLRNNTVVRYPWEEEWFND